MRHLTTGTISRSLGHIHHLLQLCCCVRWYCWPPLRCSRCFPVHATFCVFVLPLFLPIPDFYRVGGAYGEVQVCAVLRLCCWGDPVITRASPDALLRSALPRVPFTGKFFGVVVVTAVSSLSMLLGLGGLNSIGHRQSVAYRVLVWVGLVYFNLFIWFFVSCFQRLVDVCGCCRYRLQLGNRGVWCNTFYRGFMVLVLALMTLVGFTGVSPFFCLALSLVLVASGLSLLGTLGSWVGVTVFCLAVVVCYEPLGLFGQLSSVTFVCSAGLSVFLWY